MIETRVETLLTASPPTISQTASATSAAERLRDPDTDALVVVDATDEVVGIVTGSDIVALVAEESTHLPVSAFMSGPPVTTTPETTVFAAADRMREAGVRQLPVVEDGECRGLLSASTLARYVSRRRLDITWQGDPFTPPEDPGPRTAD
ncbi:CBS domain-containing protein [Halogranum amylolyticum]|nr:CBS domain-containing protein [Halogranum amylolyticum]